MPRAERVRKCRELGLCPSCGSKNDRLPIGYVCNRCLNKHINPGGVKKKQKYIKQGRCRECGKLLPTPEDERITCPGCTGKPRFDRIFQKIN